MPDAKFGLEAKIENDFNFRPPSTALCIAKPIVHFTLVQSNLNGFGLERYEKFSAILPEGQNEYPLSYIYIRCMHILSSKAI